jgi:gluconokinase
MRMMHPPGVGSAIPDGLWRYRLDGTRLVTGGALSSGGNVREWLESTLRVGGPGLERRLRAMPPAAHGLTVLPHLAGERGPRYAAHAFGAISGLTISTSAEDIAQAGLESVAIELAGISRRLDSVAPRVTRLVASGGAVLRSPAWMQMVADATGRPVTAGVAEASSRGAALYALERLGLARPGRVWPLTGRVFRPREAAGRAFRAAAARQEALYRALVPSPVRTG